MNVLHYAISRLGVNTEMKNKKVFNMVILNKSEILSSFQAIPSVGKACELDFWNIGFKSIEDLKGKNPMELYHKLNKKSGVKHDICMLYTFRCAVYFVTEKKHDPEKLKWWYWKDKTYSE